MADLCIWLSVLLALQCGGNLLEKIKLQFSRLCSDAESVAVGRADIMTAGIVAVVVIIVKIAIHGCGVGSGDVFQHRIVVEAGLVVAGALYTTSCASRRRTSSSRAGK